MPIDRAEIRDIDHRFVFYGDCCSGIPGTPFEKTFARINTVLQQLNPPPEFIVFLGDHIMGPYAEGHRLQDQWDYWFNREMGWLDTGRIPLYHTTSNHDTPDAAAEAVWREVVTGIPRNGPSGQEGLSYWVRRQDLLLVFVNTSFSGLGGAGHVENTWLDHVLATHADARYRIVAGHHPVFPVNGYGDRPLWCIARDEADAFWATLVRHNVLAYLCSHVIAFDVQEQEGVLQVCSGGAGTSYGPGGFMGDGEYHHLVHATLGPAGFHLQTVDTDGRVRERFSRPTAT